MTKEELETKLEELDVQHDELMGSGDTEGLLAVSEEAVAVARQLEDKTPLARWLVLTGVAIGETGEDSARAAEFLGEARTVSRALWPTEYSSWLAEACNGLAMALMELGRHDEALAIAAEGVEARERNPDDPEGIAFAMWTRAEVRLAAGRELDEARADLEAAIATYRTTKSGQLAAALAFQKKLGKAKPAEPAAKPTTTKPATTKPVAPEPAAKAATTKPATTKPATETAAPKPAAPKPAAKPAKAPAAKATTKPAKTPAAKPTTTKPAAKPAKAPAKKAAAKKPAAKKPAAKKPAAKKPAKKR